MAADNPQPHDTSMFQPARQTQRRLKLLLWGDCGSGKTTLALQFPAVAVIDLEGGTDHYGDDYQFDVLRVTSAEDITGAVDWLLTHEHPYRTLVVDPITLYWDALQRKWSDIYMRRKKGSKGHRLEYYDLQPRDWMAIKAEFKEFISKLIQLDMNVIVIARQKTLYADQGFMRSEGKTFDGEKSLPYVFDSILRLYRDADGRFMAENLKDRSNRLPHGCFEVRYEKLEKCLGSDSLIREATPLQLATPDQVAAIRQFITASGMDPVAVRTRLLDYGADSVEGLTKDNADLILAKLADAGSGPGTTPTRNEEASDAED